MKEQLQKRFKELKIEYESGQKMLADLEFRVANLKNTLMRISGAIQVLDEELANENGKDELPVKKEALELENTN